MLKEKDFISLEYTGRISENNKVFDTTDKNIAVKEGLFNPKINYEPTIICLGQNLLVSGLEKDILAGKEIEKEYSIKLNPENAFGKKDPKALRLVPLKHFKEQNITPYPGLQLQIGKGIATVKSVAGGRCIVDFNNPLSGHEILYTYKIISIITSKKEKVNSIFKSIYGIMIKAEEKDNYIVVFLPESVPEQITEAIKIKVKELTDVDLVIEKVKSK